MQYQYEVIETMYLSELKELINAKGREGYRFVQMGVENHLWRIVMEKAIVANPVASGPSDVEAARVDTGSSTVRTSTP